MAAAPLINRGKLQRSPQRVQASIAARFFARDIVENPMRQRQAAECLTSVWAAEALLRPASGS